MQIESGREFRSQADNNWSSSRIYFLHIPFATFNLRRRCISKHLNVLFAWVNLISDDENKSITVKRGNCIFVKHFSLPSLLLLLLIMHRVPCALLAIYSLECCKGSVLARSSVMNRQVNQTDVQFNYRGNLQFPFHVCWAKVRDRRAVQSTLLARENQRSRFDRRGTWLVLRILNFMVRLLRKKSKLKSLEFFCIIQNSFAIKLIRTSE